MAGVLNSSSGNLCHSSTMLTARLISFCLLITAAASQVTKLSKKNVLLSRKRRFLAFPANSNFVISYAYVKALMVVQPTGINALGEMDVPFPLPADTRWFKTLKNPQVKRNHRLHRRDLFTGFETAFFQQGLNGTACVKRMICEARHFASIEGKSLVKDIFSVIFAASEIDWDAKFANSCHDSTFSECHMPFLSYILGSLFGINT